MTENAKIRVAVNGYGVIGKRVAIRVIAELQRASPALAIVDMKCPATRLSVVAAKRRALRHKCRKLSVRFPPQMRRCGWAVKDRESGPNGSLMVH